MALRGNHYDAAFEAYLRQQRIPYVAVDEHRRALLNQASLKSMDFIVYSRNPVNLLIDVKGRRFPSGGDSGSHKWENWATADDIPSLLTWQEVFGTGFRAILVFAYDVEARCRHEFANLFSWRDRDYAFFGVWVDEYRRVMKTRSASWETVSLKREDFNRIRAPISQFLSDTTPGSQVI